MKFGSVSIMLIAFLCTSCATPVTKGESILILPADDSQLSTCVRLGEVQVHARIAYLWDRDEQIKEIESRIRDAVAEYYPAADTATHPTLTYGFRRPPDKNTVGTAYKCGR